MEKEKRLNVLNEVYRILKKDGIFIFTTHDINSYNGEKQIYHDYYKKVDGELLYYLHVPSIEEVKEIINQCKFNLVEYIIRKDLVDESKEVKKFSDDDNIINTIFWVVKK